MHHGRGPPSNRGMHGGDGREPPRHRGGGEHYDRDYDHGHGDPRHPHRGHDHHQSHRDADLRHRDHESSHRGHEGSTRGHESRHYHGHEGRSHDGHEGRSHDGHESRSHDGHEGRLHEGRSYSGHEERSHSNESKSISHERRSHSHESRSHGVHEKEDINRHHQNNSGLHRRPSHERHNGRSTSHNGPPSHPPQENRHRNGPDQLRPPPLPPPPVVNTSPVQQLPYIAFKLIVDPFLHRDQHEKLTRFDGITPGEEWPMEIEPKDPRKKKTSTIIIGKESLELPVPRFLVDEFYVGEVPNVEVTFENLNDNIDNKFLRKTITKYAEMEEVTILYHPNTNKHLGLAKAVFKSSKGSKMCVANLHQKTIMGQSINCYLDPGGKGCAKIFEDLTTERKPSPPPPPPQLEEEEQEPPRWGENQGGWVEPADNWKGGNSRSGHSWQDAGGDRSHPDDWRHRGGEVGGDDWGRNHIQPHWDGEEAQDGWADKPYSRQGPPTRRWGGNDPRRGRERERRGKGEWRRSQDDPEDSSRWSEEHSRFKDNSNHGYPGESEIHVSNSLPPPVPAAQPIVEPEPALVPPDPTEEDSRGVDLDTRLAMLMQKGKSNMPPFLVGSESEDTEAPAPEPKKPAPTLPLPPPVITGPLSRTPSPFASRDQYLVSIQLTIEEELKSVNESLANIPPLSQSGADQFRPPPFTGGHFAGAPPGHFPGQFPGTIPGYWSAGGHIPGASGPISGHPMTDFPGGPDWDQPDYQNPYWDNQGYYNDYGQGEYYHDIDGHTQDTGEGMKKSGRDLINSLKENVLKIVQDELKAILKKDINKKLCESYAYLLFDKWWSEQEANHKARQELEFRKKAETSSNTTMLRLPDRERVEALPRIPKPEDVTNLIEKQRESGTSSFGFGGSLGLGFRGSIPKMAKKIGKIPKENKAPDTDKVDKDEKKKHKHKDDDKERDKDITTSKDKDMKKSSKPSGNTVYNTIYSDTDDEKKEETESSDVEDSDKEEEESSSDSSSDSSSSDSSSDEESKDSEVSSDKSRDSSPVYTKSRSISPLSKSKNKPREKSKSKSPVSIRSKSRSRSKSKSISRSKSRSKSRSRSTSPIFAKAEPGDKKSTPADRRQRQSSQSSLPDTPKPSSSTSTKPLTADDDVVVAEKTPLDRRRKSQLDSGSVSSSPALSRPPTPDIQVTSLCQKDIVPLAALVDHAADNSDTETGSEIEIIEEVKSPRKSAYGKLKEDTQSASSTPGKEDATSAAEALVALSAAAAGSSNAVTPTPVKVQNVAYSPPHIMDHCYARPAPQPSSSAKQKSTSQFTAIAAAASPVAAVPEISKPVSRGFDHDYTKPRTPPRAAEIIKERPPAAIAVVKERIAAVKKSSLPSAPMKFKLRDVSERFHILYKFLTDGIDSEDVMYIKRSYEMMLNESMNQPKMAWINDTHWVDHPVTLVPDPPKKKRRVDDFSKPHKSGCARTEGFYKLDRREKMRTKYHFHRPGVDAFNTGKLGDANQQKPQKAINVSREARSQQRRMLTALGDEFNESELLKFNQLKFRRKAMMFGKSAIHDWGLFAMEHIGADEMVIEYVGDVVRPILSDTREKRYEKQGIGSSYLFRIDLDYVVDATKCGNLARFINHSCEPNCYAKVIKIDGQSKIVIYSKQTIALGEEITYDYKFPIEDEKIRCLCGEKTCRKYLN